LDYLIELIPEQEDMKPQNRIEVDENTILEDNALIYCYSRLAKD